MPLNFDRLVNSQQGQAIIGGLTNIKNSLFINCPSAGRFSEVTASPSDVPNAYSFIANNGNMVKGTLAYYASQNIFVRDQETVQIPAGYYNGITSISCQSGSSSIVINTNDPVTNLFGKSVEIDADVTNCANLFSYMEFNQPVRFMGNLVTNCYRMFSNCYNFNQPITIPDSVTSCRYMFTACNKFNQPITIPNSVTDCYGMFSQCNNQNSTIRVPSRFNNNGGVTGWSANANACIEWY